MKKIKLIFILLLFSLTQSFSQLKDDFTFQPSIGILYENVNTYKGENVVDPHQGGIKLNGRIEFKDKSLSWIGMDVGFMFNTYEPDIKIQYGFELRKSVLNNNLELALIIPKFSMPLDGIKDTGYNTPFGFAFRFFKGPFKIEVEEVFFGNANIHRLHCFYRFNNK